MSQGVGVSPLRKALVCFTGVIFLLLVKIRNSDVLRDISLIQANTALFS